MTPLQRWRPRRVLGLGDDFSDALKRFPSAQGAWDQVQQQLVIENATQDEIGFAQVAFGSQLMGLAGHVGTTIEQAIPAAAQYAHAGFTTLGAVDQVEGLISAAESGTPAPQLIQTSTGVLVGILVATGAATAGVGAAIVGVVSTLTEILSAAHLFGEPQGVSVPGCPGMTFNPPPDWMVGCVPMNGQKITAAMIPTSGNPVPNPLWRHFPDPGNPADATWFGAYFNTRMIDAAFPNYRYVAECDSWYQGKAPALDQFRKAYLAAWKINNERLLNGQKASTDAQVLYHVARTWNRAHDPLPLFGGGWVVRPADTPFVDTQYVDSGRGFFNQYSGGTTLPSCPNNPPPYVATLIREMQANQLTDDFAQDGSGLLINLGQRKNPKAAAFAAWFQSVKAQIQAQQSTSSQASSTGAAVAKVALGTTAAALIGTGIYAYIKHQAYSTVWNSIWKGATKPFRKRR